MVRNAHAQSSSTTLRCKHSYELRHNSSAPPYRDTTLMSALRGDLPLTIAA